MESRFKFRAWYKEASYMLTNIRLPVGDGTIYGWYTNHNNLRDSDYFNSEDCVIMQCTGLTDKNGVDVYEGDIFEFTAHPDGCTDNVQVSFVVRWDCDCACFYASVIKVKPAGEYNPIHGLTFGDHHSLDDFFNKNYSAEIIGNFYQNPEL